MTIQQFRLVHIVGNEQGAGRGDFRQVRLLIVQVRQALEGLAHHGDPGGNRQF